MTRSTTRPTATGVSRRSEHRHGHRHWRRPAISRSLTGGSGNDSFTAGIGNETLHRRAGRRHLPLQPGQQGRERHRHREQRAGQRHRHTRLLAGHGRHSRSTSPHRPAVRRRGREPDLTLSSGDSIEDVIGGSGDDSITGNALDNTLDGGPGNDTLAGGLGDDTYVFGNNLGDRHRHRGPRPDVGRGERHPRLLGRGREPDGDDQRRQFVRRDRRDEPVDTANVENLERRARGRTRWTIRSYGSGVTVDLATGSRDRLQRTSKALRMSLGSNYNDSITGDEHATRSRAAGATTRSAAEGATDAIDGGAGVDTLVEASDSDFTLTNTALTSTPTVARRARRRRSRGSSWRA